MRLLKSGATFEYKMDEEKAQPRRKPERRACVGRREAVMRMKGHGGSLRPQQSGSDGQGHRNKNIFYKVASEEWELGMRVVRPGGWVPGFDTLVLVSPRATSAGNALPSSPVSAFSFFPLKVKCLFFSFPSLLALGSDVLANPWGMHRVAGHRLLLLS